MNKAKKIILASSVLGAIIAPISACDESEDSTQAESKVTKGTCENGKFDLVVDLETGKIKILATPNEGYKVARAYYTFDNSTDLEYDVSLDGFAKPNGEITVYVKFEKISASISVDQSITNGTVVISNTTYKANDEINFLVTPSVGYRLKRLYYVDANNTEVAIVDKKLVWNGTSIVVKAEFESYYGTYVLDSVSGVDSSIEESMLESAKYNFVNLLDKLEIGSIEEDIASSYVVEEKSYTINGDVITYTDGSKSESLTLNDNGFIQKAMLGTFEITMNYKKVSEFDFECGKYTHTNATGNNIVTYEFLENGKVNMEQRDQNLNLLFSGEVGTYEINGSKMIIDVDNLTYVGNISLNNGVYTLSGIEINNSNQTSSNTVNINWTFEKASKIVEITQQDNRLLLNGNSYKIGDNVVVKVTPNNGYRVKRLYYVKGNNDEVEISNNEFEWLGEDITLKAEYVNYYGTYLLDDVSGVADEFKGMVLETGKYSFARIGDKLELGTLDESSATDYVISNYTYALEEDKIIYTRDGIEETLTLTDDGFSVTNSELQITLHYKLVTDIQFETGRYTHINYDGSGYPVQEYEILENKDFNLICSNDDFVEMQKTKMGTYEVYGNILVITSSNGDKYVGKIVIENGVYTLDGVFIDVSSTTNRKQEMLLKLEKSVKAINIEQSSNGIIAINPNYKVNDTIEVSMMIDQGYRLKRLYYVMADGSEVVVNNNQFVWDGSNIELKAEFVKYYGSYLLNSIEGEDEFYSTDSEYRFLEIGEKITVGSKSEDRYVIETYDYTLSDGVISIVDEGYTIEMTLIDNGFTMQSDTATIKFKLADEFEIKLDTKYVVTNNEYYQLEFVLYENGLFREIDTNNVTGKEYINEISGTYKIYGNIIVLNIFQDENYTYVGKLSSSGDSYAFNGYVFNSDEDSATEAIEWQLKESSLVSFTYPVTLTDSINGTYSFRNCYDGMYYVSADPHNGYAISKIYYTNKDDINDTTEYELENLEEFALPNFNIVIHVEFVESV